MTKSLLTQARELYAEANNELRGRISDVGVSFVISVATHATLTSIIEEMGLNSDPRVTQAQNIAAMADHRTEMHKKSPIPDIYEQNILEYTKACYILAQVIVDNVLK